MMLRRGALSGQALVMTALALVAILAVAALSVDLAGAFRASSRQSQTLELVKDASLNSLNATKFSNSPAHDLASSVASQLAADGYIGDYELWWYECSKAEIASGHASTDRLIGVELVLSQTYRCGPAAVIGTYEVPVSSSKVWTMNPYSTTVVWRPNSVSGGNADGAVYRGHVGEGGTLSSQTETPTTRSALPRPLEDAISAANANLAGGR